MATVSLTNYASQVAEIERQKKLAELLQQQAQQPIEIQSYKGIQAPIPWSAVLAKVLGQVGGQIKEARAIKQAGALSSKDQDAARGLVKSISEPVTTGGYNKANPNQPPISMDGVQNYFKPQAIAAALGQSPGAAPAPMGAPQMPVQATPMGAAPPANPIKAAVSATDVPQMTAPRSYAEQQQMALDAMASGASGPMTVEMAKLLYSDAVKKQDKAEERSNKLSDEKRALEEKIYTSGAGDTSFRIDQNTGKPVVVNVNPKTPTTHSSIDPTTGQIRSWIIKDDGSMEETTPGSPRPITKDEYDNLPKGAHYTAPDGSIKEKT